ncbi:MAG: hypothetical protein IPK74_06060 [Deltaproteobacteria bacterium]|nr:hypothetical protein [Deltaproteobacteria bacterium]
MAESFEHERDAVTDGLAAFGRLEPARDDDLARGLATVQAFALTQRRGARMRAIAIGGLAAAAALVLAVAVAPRLRASGYAVEQGEFLVQQDRVLDGSSVARGEWVEVGANTACLRVARARVCGEPGTRLRVLDDRRIELDHGRVQIDAAIAVETTRGVVEGRDDGLVIALDGGALVLGEFAATLSQGSQRIELAPGTTLAAEPEPGATTLARRPATDTSADEPAITLLDDTASSETRPTPRKPSSRDSARAPAIPSAGDMLAAARELAAKGELAAAASAYQKLVTTYPSAGESRAALVSLGRVQASRGRHSAALAAFERYLADGGGALAEEAQYGRIQALHALGRVAARDRAIDELAREHPRSVYLTKARALATPR